MCGTACCLLEPLPMACYLLSRAVGICTCCSRVVACFMRRGMGVLDFLCGHLCLTSCYMQQHLGHRTSMCHFGVPTGDQMSPHTNHQVVAGVTSEVMGLRPPLHVCGLCRVGADWMCGVDIWVLIARPCLDADHPTCRSAPFSRHQNQHQWHQLLLVGSRAHCHLEPPPGAHSCICVVRAVLWNHLQAAIVWCGMWGAREREAGGRVVTKLDTWLSSWRVHV